MTNEDYLRVIERITTVEQSVKSFHKRVDNMEKITEAFYSMAGDFKVLVQEMSALKEDVKEIKVKVDEENSRPNKMVENVKQAVINCVAVGLVGAILALIMK